jgi:hypothetical protein
MKQIDEDIIFFAFRYALGRRTGAVSMVCDYLKEHWKELSVTTQKQIKHEIQETISKDQAGDQCDIANWQEILDLK